MREEVKSTRTSWTDFRRTWKKERRFYGWGRDDREREKRFREYLKELGNSETFIAFDGGPSLMPFLVKKEAALRAEANFFDLLRGVGSLLPGSSWKEVKCFQCQLISLIYCDSFTSRSREASLMIHVMTLLDHPH